MIYCLIRVVTASAVCCILIIHRKIEQFQQGALAYI